MKKIITALLFLVVSFISIAQNNADAILGKWITTTENCLIEVYKQGGEFKAKILWFQEGKKALNDYTDEKNPDPALRTRKVLGMDVVHGLHYDPDEKQWVDGQVYDATSGKEWDSVVWLT